MRNQLVLAGILLLGASSRAGEPSANAANATKFRAAIFYPKGNTLPREAFSVTGPAGATAIVGKVPACFGYDPASPTTFTIELKQPMFVTGLSWRTTAGDSVSSARKHGRVRELKVTIDGSQATTHFGDRTAPARKPAPLEFPRNPDSQGGLETKEELEKRLPTPDLMTWGITTGIVDREYRPVRASKVIVEVAAYYHGELHQDVCLSNLEVYAVDEATDKK